MTSTYLFAIVEFLDEGTQDEEMYSVVPTNWLKTKRECYWPNAKQPHRNLFTRRQEPNYNTWKLYPCRVIKYYKNYQAALDQEMALSELSSSESTTSTNVALRINERVKHVASLREDSISPPPSLHNEDIVAAISPGPSTRPNGVIPLEDLEIITLEELPSEITIKDNASSDIEKILKLVVETNLLVKRNYDLLVELKGHKCSGTNSYPSASTSTSLIQNISLPLDSVPEIEKLEDQLLNENYSSQMIDWFKTQGGKDYKNMIKRCLVALFTNNLARTCSWTGAKGNFKLSNLTFMGLLQEAVCQTWANSNSQFEIIVKEWFRMANQRYQRQLLLTDKN